MSEPIDNQVFKDIKTEDINIFFDTNIEKLNKIYGSNTQKVKEYLLMMIDEYSYMLNMYIQANTIVLKYHTEVQEFTQIRDLIELGEKSEYFGIEFKMTDCNGCRKDCNYEGCVKLYPIK